MPRRAEWVVLVGSGAIVVLAAATGQAVLERPPPVTWAYQEDGLSRQGELIYRREGCGSCHKIFGNGATYGPALDGEGSRRSAAWLASYVTRPQPGVGTRPYRLRMPAYDRLRPDELEALVAYLQALRAPGS